MNYPYIKCLHPRTITNKYNGEYMLVPCGECEVCAMRKASQNTLRVQLESKNHLYCRFITLTYDELNIPRMFMIENNDEEYSLCGLRYSLIDPDHGNLLGYYNDYSAYQKLCAKCDSYDVPFLRKHDLQKFFKRLRKYFSDAKKKYKIPYGSFRYYAVGEYGPIHFRPHYHIILWTSCDEIAKELPEAVSSCWQLGRVTTEIPRDDVSSYVAKYVNGSCPLPSLFKLPETRPFSVHSLHLGESFFQATKNEVYESSYKDIVSGSFFIRNSYTDVSMWRSLKAYYFPRCKEYNLLSTQQRHAAYLLVERCLQRFPEQRNESLISLTERVLRDIRDRFEKFGYIDDFYHNLTAYIGTDFYITDYPDAYDKALSSLYMILRTSKHFCDFCCDGNLSYYNTHRMVNLIDKFWKDDELHMMNSSYQNIQDSTEELFEFEDEYIYRFSEINGRPVYNRIINTKAYKKFRQERIKKYNDSMKHKRLNDANRIYQYY